MVYMVALLSVCSMEVKTEAGINDMTVCSHDDQLTVGMFG